MSEFQDNSIFWISVDKVKPNPYQPRREFDPDKLNELAESIRQYGLLQPLTVTRHEEQNPDGGLSTFYELIAGERRLRASRIAGLSQIPAIIRSAQEDDRVKLELAIIENLQREDLNPIERAEAFRQLADEFEFTHAQIAKKIGKSREYVSNSIRLLSLPDYVKDAVRGGKISEGHARPILMLNDRPEEQQTLFKEVVFKKLTVREAEGVARRVAHDKVRKKSRNFDPELVELEEKLAESLGTRVFIEKRQVGGKILIDFFSNDDLEKILELIQTNSDKGKDHMLNQFINEKGEPKENKTVSSPDEMVSGDQSDNATEARIETPDRKNMVTTLPQETDSPREQNDPEDSESSSQEALSDEGEEAESESSSTDEDNIYSVRDFTI